MSSAFWRKRLALLNPHVGAVWPRVEDCEPIEDGPPYTAGPGEHACSPATDRAWESETNIFARCERSLLPNPKRGCDSQRDDSCTPTPVVPDDVSYAAGPGESQSLPCFCAPRLKRSAVPKPYFEPVSWECALLMKAGPGELWPYSFFACA